jgi:DNA-binding transcriptional LysR family regulator
MRVNARLLSGFGVLAAVIEGKSFTRAAEALGLSASGVSRSIARLESTLGVRLIDRTTRSVRLTNEGARLYESALPHLAGLEDAATAISSASSAVKGSLRVSLNVMFSRHIVGPNLGRFTKQYPSLDLTILQLPEAGDLIASGVDVAIRFGQQPASTMSSRLLLEARVVTVASPAYLAIHGRPVSPQDLSKHDCIQLVDAHKNRPFEWEFHNHLEKVKVKVGGSVTLHDCDTMVSACVGGAGIAQMLALGNEHWLANGTLVDLFPDWSGETLPLYAIRPSRRLAPAKVEAFLQFCTEVSSEVTKGSDYTQIMTKRGTESTKR